MKFKIGDRVQFTAEALATCDPAITDQEIRGEVKEFASNGRLLIRFDDGASEWRHKSELELEAR